MKQSFRQKLALLLVVILAFTPMNVFAASYQGISASSVSTPIEFTPANRNQTVLFGANELLPVYDNGNYYIEWRGQLHFGDDHPVGGDMLGFRFVPKGVTPPPPNHNADNDFPAFFRIRNVGLGEGLGNAFQFHFFRGGTGGAVNSPNIPLGETFQIVYTVRLNPNGNDFHQIVVYNEDDTVFWRYNFALMNGPQDFSAGIGALVLRYNGGNPAPTLTLSNHTPADWGGGGVTPPPPNTIVIPGNTGRQSLIDQIYDLDNGYALHLTAAQLGATTNIRGNIAEVVRDNTGKTIIYVWPLLGNPAGINELIRTLAFCLRPGDELVFHEGLYHRLFLDLWHNDEFNAGGTPGNPIIVRGYGNGQARPVFHNDSTAAGAANTGIITMSNIIIEYIEFIMDPASRVMVNGRPQEGTGRFGVTLPPRRYAIAGEQQVPVNYISQNVVIRNNIFQNRATFGSGYALTALASGTEYHGMVIEYNQFIHNTNAGIYIGAHTGEAPHYDLTIRRNFFEFSGTTQPVGGSAIGFSIQTKRGTTGLVLEENMFLNSFGPAMEWYAAMPDYDLATTLHSYIRNNVFAGSRSAGITVGGGPVTVENNIAIGNRTNISFNRTRENYRYENVWRNMFAFNNFTALATTGAAGNFAFLDTNDNPYHGPFTGEVRGNVVGEGGDELQRALAQLVGLRTKPDGFHALMDAIVAHQASDRAFTEQEVVDLFVTYLGFDVRCFGANPIVTLHPGGTNGNNFIEFFRFHKDNVILPDPNTGIVTLDFKITPFSGEGGEAFRGYFAIYGSNTTNNQVAVDAGRPINAPIMLEFRRSGINPLDIRMWHDTGAWSFPAPVNPWVYGEIYNIRVEVNTNTQQQRVTVNGVQSTWRPFRQEGFVDGPMMDIGAFGIRTWNNLGASHVIVGDIPWVDPPPPPTLYNLVFANSIDRIVDVIMNGDYSAVRLLEQPFSMWDIMTPILGWNGVVADAVRASDLNHLEQEAALGAIRRVETSINWAQTFGGLLVGPATQQVDNLLEAFVPILLSRIDSFSKLEPLRDMVYDANSREQANYTTQAWAAFTAALENAEEALYNYKEHDDYTGLAAAMSALADALIVLESETFTNMAVASSLEYLQAENLVDTIWNKVFEISTLVLPYHSLYYIGAYRPVDAWGYEPWAVELFNARVAMASGTQQEIDDALVALVNALLIALGPCPFCNDENCDHQQQLHHVITPAPVVFGRASWDSAIPYFRHIPPGGSLMVRDTYYNGTGNADGNLLEVFRAADGRTTIYAWPLDGPNPDQLFELHRVALFALRPGDEMVFHEGLYSRLPTVLPGNIGLNVGGTATNPITIRGYGNGQARPQFHNGVPGNNLWVLHTSNIVIDYMDFTSLPVGGFRIAGLPRGAGPDINGNTLSVGTTPIVPGGAHPSHPNDRNVPDLIENVTITNSIFRDMPGAYQITINHVGVEYRNIVIHNNDFISSRNAGIYVGASCYGSPVYGIIITNNFFEHYYYAATGQVGYTVQTKRGVVGLVMENNIVLHSWGPALFFYSAYPNYPYPGTMHSYVRNNLIIGGRGDGILVGGGPITVENNIMLGNVRNFRLHNYGNYRFDNVWRGIYVRNNFSANGLASSWDIHPNFSNPTYGDVIGAGYVVIEGNTVINVSDDLRSGSQCMLAFRTRPAGMAGFMADMQARSGVFTEAEVIALLVEHFDVDIQPNFGEDPITTTTATANSWRSGFYRFPADRVVQPGNDGIATLSFRVTPREDATIATGSTLRFGLMLFGSNADISNLTGAFYWNMFNTAASDFSNVPMLIDFRRGPGNVFADRGSMATVSGQQPPMATVPGGWAYNTTHQVTVEVDTRTRAQGGQRYRVQIDDRAWSNWVMFDDATPQVNDIGAFGWAVWNDSHRGYVVIGDIPHREIVVPPFPPELEPGFSRFHHSSGGLTGGLLQNVDFPTPLMSVGNADYIEYRFWFHPTVSDPNAGFQINFHPADANGNVVMGSTVTLQLRGIGMANPGFRQFHGGGAGSQGNWTVRRSYEIVVRLGLTGWALMVYENGNRVSVPAAANFRNYNTIAPGGSFANGLARVEIRIDGSSTAGNYIEAYFDFTMPAELACPPDPTPAIFEAPPLVFGWPSWQPAVDAFDDIPNCGALFVRDTYFVGSGNSRGNVIEAFRDINGRLTIYVWPITGGHPSQLNEWTRVLQYVLGPGDELVFHEGTYHRMMAVRTMGIHTGGTPENPIVIRGYGNGQAKPLFDMYAPVGNLWEISQSNLIVSGFHFESSGSGALRLDGMRKGQEDRFGNTVSMGIIQYVPGGSHVAYPEDRPVNYFLENVTIRDSIIGNFPNAYAIRVQNAATEYHNIVVKYNSFVGSEDAGLYVGSPNYHAPIFGFTLRGNFFEHSNMFPTSGSAIGYTIQTKRGVVGLVMENNLILNAWGPGIFFYGGYPHYAYPSTMHSYIRNNVILGARGDGILVGGGPITVQNNIMVGGTRNFRLHNYAGYRFDNVWRGIYIYDNFSANGIWYIHANFNNPAYGRPGAGGAIDIGDVVISGNEIIQNSAELQNGLASLLALRERPAGMDGLMVAVNARYADIATLGAFTEAEVIDLLVRYLGMYVEVNLGEDPIVTPTQPNFGWRSGFVRFPEDRVVKPGTDGIASLTFRVTPQREHENAPVGYTLRLGLFLFGSDADISNLTGTPTFFWQMMSDPAVNFTNVPMFLYFQRVNANRDPGAIRVGRGTASGVAGGAGFLGTNPVNQWAFDTTYEITIELDTINQRYRARIDGVWSGWVNFPEYMDRVYDIGQFGWAVWNNVTDTYAVIGDIPWVPREIPPFPPALVEGFTRTELSRTDGVFAGARSVVYPEPLMPNAAGYIEYRLFFHPTLAQNNAGMQLFMRPANADGTPSTNEIAIMQFHSDGSGGGVGFRWFRGGGAQPVAPWTVGRTYELIFRLGVNAFHSITILENGNQIANVVGQGYNTAIADFFRYGLAQVELRHSGQAAVGDFHAYVDFPTPMCSVCDNPADYCVCECAHDMVPYRIHIPGMCFYPTTWIYVCSIADCDHYEYVVYPAPGYHVWERRDENPIIRLEDGRYVWIMVCANKPMTGCDAYVQFCADCDVYFPECECYVAVPVFTWNIFNNGPGGTQYPRPNAGLAATGIIRMWTLLDGVGAPVYLAAADTIVALDQLGNCAMEFVRVGRVWVAGEGWQDYFNLLDINKNGNWQRIDLSIVVYGQTVNVLLVNANYRPVAEYHTVTFVVEAGAVGVYAATTITVEVADGGLIPADAIPSTVARMGFYFVEWYPSDPADHGYVTEDVTFTARFNPLFHYVTFEAGNGGVLQPVAGFGLVIRIRDGFTFWPDRVPTPVANDGYEFVKWYPANPAGFVVRENMTFTAVFAQVVPKILSITPNPAIVQRGGTVELVVTTQGMPDGAWVDLNVAWRPGLSVVGGPRFYIVDNRAVITVAATANARIGRDGFAVTARAAGQWGIPFIIDSYTFVIEVVQ